MDKSQLIEHLERIHKLYGKVLDNVVLDIDSEIHDNGNSENASESSFYIEKDIVEDETETVEEDEAVVNEDNINEEAEMTEENTPVEEEYTDPVEEEYTDPVEDETEEPVVEDETEEPVVEEPVEAPEEPVKEKIMSEGVNYSLTTDKPEALIVACIDPRFRDSFVKFGKENFGNFVFLSVPGGPGPLALDMLPKGVETLRRQIKFILKETGIKKVAVVNHDQCLWYKHNEGYFTLEQSEQQEQDLATAKSILEERFEDVEIMCYQAVLNKETIAFKIVK
jgi:hypothetical protein